MQAGQVNNVIRQIMADIKTFYDTLTISGTFTATLTGMAGATTVTVNYIVIGGLCMLRCSGVSGTSNAITMTMTGLPAACQSVAGIYVPSPALVDNSAIINGVAYASGATITFSLDRTDFLANYVEPSSLGFTASGTKGLANGWSIMYPVA